MLYLMIRTVEYFYIGIRRFTKSSNIIVIINSSIKATELIELSDSSSIRLYRVYKTFNYLIAPLKETKNVIEISVTIENFIFQ